MGYQKMDEVYGYRLGVIGLTSKREYVRFAGDEIVYTFNVNEAAIFSKDEIIEIFTRLMGTGNRKYFITEDKISFYDYVSVFKNVNLLF